MALPMQKCWARLRPAVTLPRPAVAAYHAKPHKLRPEFVRMPDPNDPNTKQWHKGPAFEAKLYGRHGSASGIRPEGLWPSPEQLLQLQEEEKEWQPSLREMLERLDLKEKEELQKQQERERLIAANMAKMPKMVEEWRKSKKEAQKKVREEKAKKERLLALAREKFGTAMDPRSPKFLEMVKEMEKEEKRKLKAVRRMQQEEERAAIAAALSAAAAAKTKTTQDSDGANAGLPTRSDEQTS